MKRITILSSLFAMAIVPSVAMSSAASPATYILQTSSNLDCENLSIELVSQASNSSHSLHFEDNAFAAVELTPGAYEFGKITCITQSGQESYDVLKDSLKPFTVDEATSYFGGRMILEEVIEKNVASEPKVFSDCPRVRSSARGQSSDGCFDGSSNNLSRTPDVQLRVYAPQISEQEFKTVQSVYTKASKEQLVLLPVSV